MITADDLRDLASQLTELADLKERIRLSGCSSLDGICARINELRQDVQTQTDLRVAAEERAGKRNVAALEKERDAALRRASVMESHLNEARLQQYEAAQRRIADLELAVVDAKRTSDRALRTVRDYLATRRSWDILGEEANALVRRINDELGEETETSAATPHPGVDILGGKSCST